MFANIVCSRQRELSSGTHGPGRRAASVVVAGVAVVAAMAGCTSSSKPNTSPTSRGPTVSTHAPNSPAPTTSSPAAVPMLSVQRKLNAPALLLRYALGSVWAVDTDGSLVRYSVAGKRTARLARSGVRDVRFTGRQMYVLTASAVEQLDPATGRVEHRRALANAVSFDVHDGVAYVEQQQPAGATLHALDVATGRDQSYRLPSALSGQEVTGSVAVDPSGNVWVIDASDLLELRGAPLTVQKRYSLPFPGSDLLASRAGVFIATQNPEGGIVRIEPNASQVSSCWPTGDALQMVGDGPDLWVSAAAGLTELAQQSCQVLGQATPPDQSGTGVAVLPGQVWAAFPQAEQIEVVRTQ